jgi:biotin transport system substrate-specific component
MAAVAGLMTLGAAARFELPFSPVPITMQTFVALIAGYLVSPRQAVAGMALYLTMAAAGAPLLAVQGIATMGYLAAMLLCPLVATRFRSPLAGMLAATALIYALGAGWLVAGLGLTPFMALSAGVLPFLPGDALKVLLAVAVVRRVR